MKMKLKKGMPPKTKTASKSTPNKGDTRSADAGKMNMVKKLVAQKSGKDGTDIKTSKKADRQARKKRLEGVKF
jgi:hypothetical protein